MPDRSEEVSQSRRRPLTFLRGFITRPKEVGSVIPSSRFLIKRILDPVDVGSARVIVEWGPGTGVVTREILKRMHRDAKLVAMELNPSFVKVLRKDLPDPRLTIYQGPARELTEALAKVGEKTVDLAVSGIPFSTMGREEGEATLHRLKELLSPQGRFVAYQFRSEVRKLGEPILGPAETYGGFWNIPPMKVYVWRHDHLREAAQV